MDNTVKPEIERLGGVFDELEDIKADMKILQKAIDQKTEADALAAAQAKEAKEAIAK